MNARPRSHPVPELRPARRAAMAGSRAIPAAALLLLACGSPGARAADVTATLPVVSGPPGAVVSVPIDLDRPLAGLGVYAIDLRLPLDPAFVSGLSLAADGPLHTWGAPFQNLQPTFFVVSSGGGTPVSATGTRLASFTLTISPAAVPGTQVPLTLAQLRFNGGTPSVATVAGALQVVSALDVPRPPPASPRIGPVRPNPARGPVSLEIELPEDAGAVTLAVYSADGRRLRTLLRGAPGRGRHEVGWDGRDAMGRPSPPGLYFLRLTWGAGALHRRFALTR